MHLTRTPNLCFEKKQPFKVLHLNLGSGYDGRVENSSLLCEYFPLTCGEEIYELLIIVTSLLSCNAW